MIDTVDKSSRLRMKIRTWIMSEMGSTEAVRGDNKRGTYVKLRLQWHYEIVLHTSRSSPSPRLSDQLRLSADGCEVKSE